jgi:hypothetical protein
MESVMGFPRRSVVFFLFAATAYPHDVITTKVTFDREIVRLFNDHCVSCHRKGGSSFPLTTWQEARPWAKAIGEEVLRRRMPPWGAVKGFGDFRNDQGLTPEQLELVVDWEEGGAPEGEEKDLPPAPKAAAKALPSHSPREVVVSGEFKLTAPLLLDGLWPKFVPAGASYQITAELPDGSVEPLLWLDSFKKEFDHPFLFRNPLQLPAGTLIHGVGTDAGIALLPAKPARPKAPAASRH